MELFYSNNINKTALIILDSIESKHCIKVLRKSIGDEVDVVDGIGNLYKGVIELDNPRECHVKVLDSIKNYDKRDYYVHIAISPIKNNSRIEWFVEKSVEIGIDEISFINCERTLKHTVKTERIFKTAISAMKQTLKASLPKINNICSFDEFIANNKESNNSIDNVEEIENSNDEKLENIDNESEAESTDKK